MVTPHDCESNPTCKLFFEFWEGIVGRYPVSRAAGAAGDVVVRMFVRECIANVYTHYFGCHTACLIPHASLVRPSPFHSILSLSRLSSIDKGRTFFGRCASSKADAIKKDHMCGPDVLHPSFIEWSHAPPHEGKFVPYTGGTTFHALSERVREQITGEVSASQRWLKKYHTSSDLFTQNVPTWTQW